MVGIVTVIFGGYMLVNVAVLGRDKWTKRRQSEDTRDTQRRVDGIVTFCTGVLVGFISGGGFSIQPPQSDYGTGAVLHESHGFGATIPVEDPDTLKQESRPPKNQATKMQ